MTVLFRRSGGGGVAGGGVPNVAHGDAVTITGSSLGSGLPSVLTFNGGSDGVLETGTLGTTPADANGWIFSRFNEFPTISNDGERGKCFVDTLSGGSDFEVPMSYDMGAGNVIAPGGFFYATFWLRSGMTLANNGNDQLKIWRLGARDTINDDDTQIWMNYFDGDIQIHENPTGTSDTFYDGPYYSPASAWKRIEIKLQASTQGGANGILQVRVGFNGVSVPAILQATSAGDSRELTQMRNYPGTDRYRYFLPHLGIFNGPTNATIGTDDHYVSNAMRRVELWNSLTPSLADKREVQKPTSWINNQVDVAHLNRGAFPTGTGYVVVLADSMMDTVQGSQQITVV